MRFHARFHGAGACIRGHPTTTTPRITPSPSLSRQITTTTTTTPSSSFPSLTYAHSRLCKPGSFSCPSSSYHRHRRTPPPPRRGALTRLTPLISSRTLTSSALTMATAQAEDVYLADSPPSVVQLQIAKHFDALDDKQKRYAHFISKAAFAGTRIVLRQVSPESEPIYDLIVALHRATSGDWTALGQKAGVDASEVRLFTEYAAMFLGNTGNYKSFGDAKFLPRCSAESVRKLAQVSPDATKAWEQCKDALFSFQPSGMMHLGHLEDGHLSTYYPDSPSITKDEIDAVKDWAEKVGLLPENNRLVKTDAGDFRILIASAIASAPAEGDTGKEAEFTLEKGPLKGKKITLVYGDHAREMAAITGYIKKAAENAANDAQRDMHLAYAKSFETGSMLAFKDSQRHWIKDKGPMIECNIGFIETYRDPAGIRGEWEGFASIVNIERTRAFGELVEKSPSFIPLLPWGADFEKDQFLSPDFTSLEVLTFAGSGIPAGINIPNFDDIRQNDGFKNVSLGNVLSAKAPNEKIPFIADADLGIYQKYRDPAFEVQVGLHELTGHGCGKLLQETKPGVFNFNKDSPPVSPLTGKPITTWYKPGQTWGSVFGSLAASYEECRAELVAMYLGCEFETLKIFGFGDGTPDINGPAGDVLYAAYLQMARAGLISLEMWDPKSRKWGQAHSQARFSILQCFLQAGEGFCELAHTKDDYSDLEIKLDRSKILTVGRDAVGKYLQKLHIYKSTADAKEGLKFYTAMTTVDPDHWGTTLRNVVLRNKQPRKVFVQANTTLDEASGKVTLTHDEASLEGLIKSYADRDL